MSPQRQFTETLPSETGTADPATLELRVLGGPQAGARVPWPTTGGALVLRAGEDIDEAIRADLLIDSERPALLRLRAQRDGEARVEVLSGEVTLGEHTHATGAVFRWPLLVPLQIGTSAAIAVGAAQTEIWPLAPLPGDSNRSGDETDDAADSSRRADAAGTGADAGSDVQADTDGNDALTGAPPRGRVDTWLAGGGAVLGIAGLVWSLLITLPTAPHAAVPVLVAQAPVPAPRDELVFEAPAAGRAEPAPVEAKPAADPEPPRPPTLPSAGNEPGKRIVTLVSQGQLPHLVTADGTRYFVGAVLPSGHRVAAVLPQSLVLERDGQQSRIEF